MELKYTRDGGFLKGLYSDPSIPFDSTTVYDAFMVHITNSRRLYDPKRCIRLDASISAYSSSDIGGNSSYSFKDTDPALNRWYLSEEDAKAGYEIR
jgi:hypothetical protein